MCSCAIGRVVRGVSIIGGQRLPEVFEHVTDAIQERFVSNNPVNQDVSLRALVCLLCRAWCSTHEAMVDGQVCGTRLFGNECLGRKE